MFILRKIDYLVILILKWLSDVTNFFEKKKLIEKIKYIKLNELSDGSD